MRPMHDRITRRVALARFAGLTALASARPTRGGEGDGAERPTARIFVSVDGRPDGLPPAVSGTLAIDPEDGTWTQVLPDRFIRPKVSPDGRKVLCLQLRDVERRGLYVADTRGGEPPRKVADGIIAYYSWSPDGDRIACSMRKGDGYVTFLLRADGSGRVEVPVPATDFVVAWSPGGAWFATWSRRGRKLDEPQDYGTQAVYLMHPDGTGERLLLEVGEYRVIPSFAPDGRSLLFTTYQPRDDGLARSARIETIGVDGDGRRTLLGPRGRELPIQATWSPDGRELAVLHREDHAPPGEEPTREAMSFHLAIASADGQRSRRLDVLDGIPFSLVDWR